MALNMGGSPLFHKKSKSRIATKHSNQDGENMHIRKWSSSSSSSQASSESSDCRRARYGPLSSHPPLSLNTSPRGVPGYDMARYRDDEERESRFFNQTNHVEDHILELAEYSPVKGRNCYFERPKGRPYVYDQGSQWPLKDWQATPPGFAEMDSAATSPSSSPTRPTHHRRRNTDWMNDADVFVKRGAWKRQGIVFHLDSKEQELQEEHFELPE
ncbi:Uu.00g118920.m01.CDS01 [Anthostomella pinea]|uniref:Uu.00g118920.m01.CDS01 n=1 Tax=Anthostomella pinea TaxID=933095 RepID=A0AAI8YEN4_9PEZI|nr:Uu.00g118920.m01.CDS01 [Anthostomella pinea]